MAGGSLLGPIVAMARTDGTEEEEEDDTDDESESDEVKTINMGRHEFYQTVASYY